MHCMCVQTTLNPLNWPAAGWVTTTRAAVKILPPPTGMSDVDVSAPPPGDAPPLLAAAPLAEPTDPPPQAASVPARPARPAPASRPRRVVSALRSWVTGDPP